MKSKKAESKALSIVIDMLILAVIAVVVIIIVQKSSFNFFRGLHDCENQYKGTCLHACGDYPAEPAGNSWCERIDKTKPVCCKTGLSGSESGSSGSGANSDYFLVALTSSDKSDQTIKSGDKINLEMENNYYLNINMKDIKKKLYPGDYETKDIKYCGIWLEERSGSDISKKYAISNLGSSITKSSDFEKSYNNNDYPIIRTLSDTVSDNNAIIKRCDVNTESKSFDPKKDLVLYTRALTPQNIDAGRTYVLNIIVFGEEVTKKLAGSTDASKAYYEIKDPSNWAAHFTSSFEVKPIIEVTDVSSTWVIEDDFNVRAFSPFELDSVEVAIVSETEMTPDGMKPEDDKRSLYQKLYDTCSSDKIKGRYTRSLYKISTIKTGSSFRIFGIGKTYEVPKYEGQEQKITVIDNLAKVHLDAASFIYGYGEAELDDEGFLKERDESALVGESNFEDIFVESENLIEQYICIRARVTSSADQQPREIISYSTQPLRIDIAPPSIGNSDDFIKVVYPKPFKKQIEEMQQKVGAGQTFNQYYFQQYPYVEITDKCLDKSGCKNFDYYFKPTQIAINIQTNDAGDAAVDLLLGMGLNLIYQEILKSNPLTTVCPLPESGSYRRNTQTQIRFYDEQGMFCIKISDSVGNYKITWKPVYNPYDVVEKVMNTLTEPDSITPSIN